MITSSVSQVRMPKFVRVLYGVRSASQQFSTLLLNCSALCELNSLFYSLCLNHAAECPPKRTVGPKMAVFRPFHRGKKVAKMCWNISMYMCCVFHHFQKFSETSKTIQGPVGEVGVYWGASLCVVSRKGTALRRFHTLFSSFARKNSYKSMNIEKNANIGYISTHFWY